MRSPRRLVLVVSAVALVVGACSEHDFEFPTAPSGPPSDQIEASTIEPAWSRPLRRLASAPVAVGGRAVVYAAGRGRLSLLVVDPDTGAVVARRPSSSSYVTPGVPMEVVARGGLVYHYRPTNRPQLARLEVYDVRRDRVVGRSAPAYFWSLPTGCRRPDGGSVCVAAGETNPASVYRVDPSTAEPRIVVPDAGRSLGAGLYDASDTISLVRADHRAWQRSAPAMLGGRPVTPSEGWDWERQGSFLIGSFGAVERRTGGGRLDRPGHIARVDPRTGRTLWVRPGTAYCELDLMEAAVDGPRRWFRCATSGRLGPPRHDRSARRTTITRFDPTTGEPLWSTPPARWDAVHDVSTWVKLSDSLVASRRGGVLVTLDVDSGQVTRADPNAIGWCAQQRVYRDRDSAARPPTRVAGGLASPCRADGTPVTSPDFLDPVFGVRLGATFVWASTTGLHAVRTVDET
jgi:outer membrane protein assembly factor BamB